MVKGNLWIFIFLIACLMDCSQGSPPSKPGNKTREMPPYEKQPINKRDLAIGLGCGFAGLCILLICFAIYLKSSRSSSNPKPDASNIYVVLPNGQTIQGQKVGANVTVSNPDTIYTLGGLGGAPSLPPRVVDDDDTYARIVESIYNTTPADKVLSIPINESEASTSTGGNYVRGFLGPSLLNPAYGTYRSPSLLNMAYGDPRMMVEYRSHDALSFTSSTGEGQASQGAAASQPVSPQIARSVSQSERVGPEQGGSDESNTQNNSQVPPAPAANVIDSQMRGAYGPLPGPLLLRPMLDRGHVSYVLDAETGYRSRVLHPHPEQFIYVRDPESGYRTRVLGSGAAAQHVYVYDPESGVRMRAAAPPPEAQIRGEGHSGNRPSQEPQASSSSGASQAAASAATDNATEQCHSGDSHDSQSSTASGASSATPLASASIPMDIRPSVPRQGYAATAAAAPEVADVPTVIRRYNADTGEEYIYTLAVSRLPRTNVNR